MIDLISFQFVKSLPTESETEAATILTTIKSGDMLVVPSVAPHTISNVIPIHDEK